MDDKYYAKDSKDIPQVPTEIDDKLTIKQLKGVCRVRKLKGYSEMNKAELIAFINAGGKPADKQ